MRKLTRDNATDMGKKGGRNRAKALTSKRRKEISAAAVKARWEKFYAKKAAGQKPSKDSGPA